MHLMITGTLMPDDAKPILTVYLIPSVSKTGPGMFIWIDAIHLD